MAKIITFKTRRQLETAMAAKVVREWEAYLEWEEANMDYVRDRVVIEESSLSQQDIAWLNEWVENNDKY